MTWLDLDPKFGTELTTYICEVLATNNCMSVRRPSSVHTRAVISETYGDETTRWRQTLGCAMRRMWATMTSGKIIDFLAGGA
jgi:hypothetical protein